MLAVHVWCIFVFAPQSKLLVETKLSLINLSKHIKFSSKSSGSHSESEELLLLSELGVILNAANSFLFLPCKERDTKMDCFGS